LSTNFSGSVGLCDNKALQELKSLHNHIRNTFLRTNLTILFLAASNAKQDLQSQEPKSKASIELCWILCIPQVGEGAIDTNIVSHRKVSDVDAEKIIVARLDGDNRIVVQDQIIDPITVGKCLTWQSSQIISNAQIQDVQIWAHFKGFSIDFRQSRDL